MITPKLKAIRKRAQIAARLAIEGYSDSQERDEGGKWSASGAATASKEAHAASNAAHDYTGTHKGRAALHRTAAGLHKTASEAHASLGHKEDAEYHGDMAKHHKSGAWRDSAMHRLGQAARTAGHVGLSVLNELAKRAARL